MRLVSSSPGPHRSSRRSRRSRSIAWCTGRSGDTDTELEAPPEWERATVSDSPKPRARLEDARASGPEGRDRRRGGRFGDRTHRRDRRARPGGDWCRLICVADTPDWEGLPYPYARSWAPSGAAGARRSALARLSEQLRGNAPLRSGDGGSRACNARGGRAFLGRRLCHRRSRG